MTKMTKISYQCTPTSKFAADDIPTDLAEKLAPHLEPINYNPWAQLQFQDQLTGAEMFKITRQAALKEINKLVESGIIKLEGKGRGAHYVIV